MKPRRTPKTTTCLELPGGNEDNYLWMFPTVDVNDKPLMVTFWEPNAKERAAIARGEKITLICWGKRHPPIAMTVESLLYGDKTSST